MAENTISVSECRVSNDDGETSLHLATKKNDVESMQYFFDKGNLNERTVDESTALHLAFINENSKTVKLLLNREADICITTNDENTSLHLAVFDYSSDLDDILFVQGIENIINKKDKDDRAAIHTAMNKQYFTSNTVEIMDKLLNVPKMNIDVTDEDDTTSLIWLAIRMGTLMVSQNEMYNAIKLLLSKKPELDKQDKAGSTAFIDFTT